MGGIAAARGKFVIMGDADDSYDFLEIPKFVDQLRAGHELVQGCRLPSGGGRDPARRHAAVAPLARQPGVLVARAADVPRRRSTTCTAACAASAASCSTGSTCAARGWNSPPR